MIHGASDGWPGWFVEKLGDYMLSHSEAPLDVKQSEELAQLAKNFSAQGSYHKILSRHVRKSNVADASPQPIAGSGASVERRTLDKAHESGFLPKAATTSFEILENGVRYEMSFNEGYSVGCSWTSATIAAACSPAISLRTSAFQIGNRKSEIGNLKHLRLHLRLFRLCS
ncbi:MAG: hypothetical protein WDM80_13775 [Limisphaerales bacterium]